MFGPWDPEEKRAARRTGWLSPQLHGQLVAQRLARLLA